MTTNLQRQWDRSWSQPQPPKPFGGTLGVIAIAFGIGVLGAYVLDLHAHTCDSCGYRWRHLGAFNLGDERSHTCTNCGKKQWWKDGVPYEVRALHDAYQSPQGTTTSQEFREPRSYALSSGR